MNTLLQDIQYGLRTLLGKPGFLGVVVVTLALGIGANTAVFSVLNATVLRPLPFEEPDRLMMVWETRPKQGTDKIIVSYPNFQDWRDQNRVFEDISVLRRASMTLTGRDQPEHIRGARVSAGFFPILGVEPALGRTLLTADDEPGAEEVAVLSDSIWRRCFAADPDIVGRTITLEGRPHVVVGVLPAEFGFPIVASEAEVWLPAIHESRFVNSRGAHGFVTVARLKGGVSPQQAQVEMDAICARLQQQYPKTNEGWGVNVVSLHEHVVGQVRPVLLLLLGAVGLVLLVACANVGSMLMARSEARRTELAVRGALGADRIRLVRQLLTESLLLALAGGLLGVLLAAWSMNTLTALVPADLPRAEGIGLDGPVYLFSLGLSLCTCLVFGLIPALRATSANLTTALKSGVRAGFTGAGDRRLRGGIVVSQIGLSLVLLIGAGLLLRSFHRLTSEHLGFEPENVLTFRLALPAAMELSPAQRADLYGGVLDRLEALPGVEAACANTAMPLTGEGIGLVFSVLDDPDRSPDEQWGALYGSIDAGYFEALDIPLLRGRSFTERDATGAPGVMVINDAMARTYWPDSDPLGRHVKVSRWISENDPESFEIVGVVADTRESIFDEPEPYMYVPMRQQTWSEMAFAAHAVGDPAGLVGAVRSEVAAVTREAAPHNFRTLEQHKSNAVAQQRFTTVLLGVYAGIALALAVVGVYGVLSYSVAQRTHEIGVRMAIGAQRSDVVHSVLRQGLVLIFLGSGLGLALAFASTRVLSNYLHEIRALDPITFVAVPVVLSGFALLACYLPARRASKVDPMVALRYE